MNRFDKTTCYSLVRLNGQTLSNYISFGIGGAINACNP